MFVFSRASFKEILLSVPEILDNPTHPPKTMKRFWYPILAFCRDYKIYIISFILFAVIGVVKKDSRRWCFPLLSAISLLTAVYFAVFITNGIGYSAIMIPLTPLGLVAFIYTENKDYKVLSGWIIGIVYALCMHMASNNAMYVIANACTVSSCLSMFLIDDYLKENSKNTYRITILFTIIILQFFSETYVMLNHVYWEDGPDVLVSEIKEGPLRGVVTTSEKKEFYEQNYQNLSYLKREFEIEGRNILMFKSFPSGYLILDEMRMGAYSAWLGKDVGDLNDEKIQLYYEYHQDKIPTYIYVDPLSAQVWDKELWHTFAKREQYDFKYFDNGAWLFIKESYE